MTRWSKTVASLALAVCLVLSFGVSALAVGEVDLTQAGSVTLSVADENWREDMVEHSAAVDVAVYKVAAIDENGLFHLTEKFSALAEGWEEQLGPSTNMEDLTEKVLALVQAEPEKPGDEPVQLLPPDATVEKAAMPGAKIDLSAQGLGLYLLVPADAETEQFVYTFSPLLLAVPSVGTAEDAAGGREGEPDPDAEGRDWQYSYTVFMKPERSDRLGRLEISKALATYNETLGPTTFVFQVEAVKDGQVVYSNVVSLTFSGAGNQTALLTDVPVGATVTVTEIYSGASYAVSGAGTVEVTIPDLDLPEGENVARAGFANDYTDRLIPDTSVVNTFTYGTTGGVSGWTWEGQNEEAQG